jgi:hypothetical protein
LLSGIVRATDATAEELLQVDSLGDDEEKAVDEISPASAADEADPMGISVSRSDTSKSILGLSLSGKAKAEGSKVGSVVGFAKTASVVGPGTAAKTVSVAGSTKDQKTATIVGSGKDQKAGSVAASSKMAKTIRSVPEPVVRDFLRDDFALLPGGYVGADALLLGKTVCQKTYLAIRESTFLEIKKDFFESDLFVNVRKDLEVDLAIQEKAEDTKSMLRKMSFKQLPVAREFDELGDEEDDIPDPTDSSSSSGGYDCYIM